MWEKIKPWLGFRRLTLMVLAVLLLAAGTLAGSVWWIHRQSAGHTYTAVSVPEHPVAIVLGAEVNRDGQPSGFLAARLELARQLYVAGKVRAILVSGDDGQPEYNEVDPMRTWLIDRGVPATKVVADYAGFDTYSTCVRATKIFGIRSATVVTQSFHLPRAVALCRGMGIDAIGVGDDTARQWSKPWFWGALRDKVACVKAVFELFTKPDPKFLGPRETGIDDALRG